MSLTGVERELAGWDSVLGGSLSTDGSISALYEIPGGGAGTGGGGIS